MIAASDLELIIAAATEAGELAQAYKARGLTTTYKTGDSPVTDADLAADELLKSRLLGARPDYGWLSEETADAPDRLSRRRLFVVDPIDGTRSFAGGKPWWCISIAVVEDGRSIAGVVLAPDLEETYAAELGGGATLNGAPITASTTDALEDCAMLGDARMFAHPAWRAAWPPMRIESRNSTALRLCFIADGAFDATLTLVEKADWDVAAGDLIAREAGAHVSDHKGRPYAYNRHHPAQTSLLACARPLAPLILQRTEPIDLRTPTPSS